MGNIRISTNVSCTFSNYENKDSNITTENIFIFLLLINKTTYSLPISSHNNYGFLRNFSQLTEVDQSYYLLEIFFLLQYIDYFYN